MKRRSFLLASSMLAPFATGIAHANSGTYPNKPVRVLIPFAPGQGSDILARALGEQLGAQWHQPVLVENKAGANGALAAQELAVAAADGHTLLLTSNSPIVVNPVLYKNLKYDVSRDFRPVTLLSTTPLALVANLQQPFKTVPELLAYAKANPGKLSYASIGSGSTSHMCMEAFKQATGIDVVHVPYKGSAPALADLVGGHVQIMIDGLPSALPHVRGGRAQALAITGSTESKFLPGVPTLESLGIQGVPAGGWYGLMAPARTDPAILAQLYADFTSTMKRPDVEARLKTLNLERAPDLTSAQFESMIRRETLMWADTAKRLGLYKSE
ncbi:Bug family tripartite tricarboxylate transporter substrate binding protein [Ottowia sp.]|uniref:Bug family tripartite tricarboxylate transporter substrate binding protein n=1 Tax=Ottowia sp. TaxID=1898956 RepID=UPI003C73E144